MHPAARLARRPAPPAAASMAPPSPPPHRQAPPFRPPELPLPSALVPPKKRRVMRTPPKATTPIPPPPPPVPAAALDLAVPAPTPPPRADPVSSPQAGDQKPTLPPPPRAAEKPSLPPPPTAQNPSSSPPPPAAEDENPSALPPPATQKPSSPPTPPTDAPANRAPTRKVRKVVTKVVPKETVATREAAAARAGAASAAVGALQPGEGHAPDKPPTDRNAAADEVVEAEQSLGETATTEPSAGCNSIAVREAQLGKEMVTGCGDAPVVEELVSRGEEKDEAGMSEWQRRRKTEVFVGGLNRDAKEEDVRAVLAEAGEIAEVRMIMDSMTKKNKGYCFVRYHEAAQARKAIAKFGNVKVLLHPLG